MKSTLALAAGLAALAGTAHAQINALFSGQVSAPLATAERVTLSNLSSSGLVLDGLVTSRQSGYSTNPLFQMALEPGSRVTGLDWSLYVNASNPARLSDLRIALYSVGSDGTPLTGVLIGPGQGINTSGTLRLNDERFGLSNAQGFVDLASLGLDFNAGSDHSIFIEVFSMYSGSDLKFKADSTLNVVTGVVPAPGTAAVFGLMGLTATRRRRRA